MDYQKHYEIVKDLLELAKKHNILIITGTQQDPKISYQFDGFGIFITDGSPSKRKKIDDEIGEKMLYESTYRLTLTKNRYKNEN